ncbi:MAG: 3-deoxy-8-phosphooctulonate synthase [Alphaproteobacteria bacterium]
MTNPNSVVRVANIEIGNAKPLSVVAGPCALESREHALEMAAALKEVMSKLKLGFIFKTSFDKANRSSISGPRGVGLAKALPIFAEVKEKYAVPIITDVHEQDHCKPVAEVVDILQIPAFLCRQTDLLIAAAKAGKPVNVKKGQFMAPWDMKNLLEKITGAGNPNVILCERGASFGYNTLVSDMRALPIMASFGCPVMFDATHSVQQPGGLGNRSGGQREFVPTLARAAVAVGIASLFMETHHDPDHAMSDGPNMIKLRDLPPLLSELSEIDRIAKKRATASLYP